MERINCPVRNDWKKRVEELGFSFHSIDGTYWDESAFYQFSMREVEELEAATAELFARCLDAVQYVIDRKLYDLFRIDPKFAPLIEASWNNDAPSIYGRFDLVYDGKHGGFVYHSFCNYFSQVVGIVGSVQRYKYIRHNTSASVDGACQTKRFVF